MKPQALAAAFVLFAATVVFFVIHEPEEPSELDLINQQTSEDIKQLEQDLKEAFSDD